MLPQTAHLPPADETAARIERLVLLTRRLTDLIRREIVIFRTGRPAEAQALADEKTDLSGQYTREMTALKRDAVGLARLRPAQTAELREATRLFRNALSELSDVLARVRRVSEGIVHAIAEDVNARRAKPVGYGNTAAATTSERSLPLALNRVV